jgi:sugar lactone lactonase YvrE
MRHLSGFFPVRCSAFLWLPVLLAGLTTGCGFDEPIQPPDASDDSEDAAVVVRADVFDTIADDTKLPGCPTDCQDADPCTTDGCDSSLGVCTHVAIVGCTAAALPCSTDASCPGGVCDPNRHLCVACLQDADCGKNAVCSNAACRASLPCVTDAGCKSTQQVCDFAIAACVDCVTPADCPAAMQCAQHTCVPAPKPCTTSKECPGVCNKLTGTCVTCVQSADCPPERFCSADGTCASDVCAGPACVGSVAYACAADGSGFAAPTPCEDGAVCTTDTCSTDIGCLHAPASGTCDDGDLCTSGDACAVGTCVGGPAIPCVDSSACTADACVSSLGCVHTPQPALCDDAIACTVDACDGSGCSHAASDALCQDGNACTADACAPTGCTQLPLSGSGCEDGDAYCTVNDVCTAGTCSGLATNCDDGNPCTIDTCSAGVGCVHASSGAPCDDGDPCTVGETCIGAVCSVSLTGKVTTVAGNGVAADVDGSPALSVSLNQPTAIARTPLDQFYVTEAASSRIRWYEPAAAVVTFTGYGSGSTDAPFQWATFTAPDAIAIDKAGIVYIADAGTNRIRRIIKDQVDTFAGSSAGFADGKAALFNQPRGLAVDGTGAVWVADRMNHRVRKIAPDGTTTTIAGNGNPGLLDGPGANAQFNQPCAIITLPARGAIVADCGNFRLRKIAADGGVSTFAGSTQGFQDGVGTSARFGLIGGLAFRASFLLVSDTDNRRIRSVAPDGTVSTIAGSGLFGALDGPAGTATFGSPGGIAVDGVGDLIICDTANNRLRKLSFASHICDDGSPCIAESCGGKDCVYKPLAKGATCDDGNQCTLGDACDGGGDCVGTQTLDCNDDNPCTSDLCIPAWGTCGHTPAAGTCDDGNVCSLAHTCAGETCSANTVAISTLAGNGWPNWADGQGKNAWFSAPGGIGLATDGGFWVADSNNHLIRHVSATGIVTTIGASIYPGFLDGPAATAKFNWPSRVLVSPLDGSVLIADAGNNRIRKYANGSVSTFAGSGVVGYSDGPAAIAQFSLPMALAWHPDGLIYVADQKNHRIRSLSSDGTVATIAGSGLVGATDGPVLSASFSAPTGLCIDKNAVVYVTDSGSHSVRRIQNGLVSTFAGGGLGYQDGPAGSAKFANPVACATDDMGNVFVADQWNYRVRRIDPQGNVSTVAGKGPSWGGPGPNYQTPADGSVATAVFAYPNDVAVGPSGQLWIADGDAIRRFTPPVIDCNDGLACTTDACDPGSRACVHGLTANGGPCTSGNACAVGEICQAGVCGGGSTDTCNDNNACTSDSCDPTTGCKHVSTGAPGCCTANVFSADFSTGASGIGFLNSAGAGKGWQVWLMSPITDPSDVGSAGLLYYGDPAAQNYNFSQNSGVATLPPLQLDPLVASALTFDLYMDTETGTYDDLTIAVLFGGVTKIVWKKSTAAVTPKSWKSVSVDLSAYKGLTVTISFTFNTVDAVANTTFGVAIDKMKVVAACP